MSSAHRNREAVVGLRQERHQIGRIGGADSGTNAGTLGDADLTLPRLVTLGDHAVSVETGGPEAAIALGGRLAVLGPKGGRLLESVVKRVHGGLLASIHRNPTAVLVSEAHQHDRYGRRTRNPPASMRDRRAPTDSPA